MSLAEDRTANGRSTASSQAIRGLPLAFRRVLAATTWLGVTLVVLPTAYLVVWTLWGTDTPGKLGPFAEPTIAWVRDVLRSPEWRLSFTLSFLVACIATVAGTLAAATHAYLARMLPRWVDRLTFATLLMALLNPLIPYGLALRMSVSSLGIPTFVGLVVGQTMLVLPLQYLIFEVSREAIPRDMLRAARSLGASHATAFRYIYAPRARLAIVSSLVIGFFVAFDDIVVARSLIDGPDVTVPLRLWNGISDVVTPTPAVVAVIVLALALVGQRIMQGVGGRALLPGLPLRRVIGAFRFEVIIASIAVIFTFAFKIPDGWLNALWWSGVLACVGWIGASVIKARELLVRVLTQGNVESVGLHDVPRLFTRRRIAELLKASTALSGGGWTTLDRDSLAQLSRSCFEECKGRYIGTDRHVPSEFRDLYPQYLSDQLKRNEFGDDVRIVMYDAASLAQDAARHPAEVNAFLEQHVREHMRLYAVPWHRARLAAAEAHLETPDLGVFADRFVVFFQPPADENGRFGITMQPMSSDIATRVATFLAILAEHASVVVLENGQPAMLDLDVDERTRLSQSLMATRVVQRAMGEE